jgi:hypothetical protein
MSFCHVFFFALALIFLCPTQIRGGSRGQLPGRAHFQNRVHVLARQVCVLDRFRLVGARVYVLEKWERPESNLTKRRKCFSPFSLRKLLFMCARAPKINLQDRAL